MGFYVRSWYLPKRMRGYHPEGYVVTLSNARTPQEAASEFAANRPEPRTRAIEVEADMGHSPKKRFKCALGRVL